MSGLSWNPSVELSAAEERIAKRLKRTGKLFVFLRRQRHRLFDAAFQAELATMYSDVPRGAPKPPALLAMVTLLQAYEQKSDAAAVEDAVFDARWRMVLDLSDEGEPGFSQGVLVDFRRRLIAHDMDKRLMERTVELAQETGEFGASALRVALDSAPLWGAGRVEDTFNLVAHAAHLVIGCAAALLDQTPAQIREQAGLELLGERSIKAELDIDWSDEEQKQDALNDLLVDIGKLRRWLDETVAESRRSKELVEALATLEEVIAQDIEPDPGGGGARIQQGTSRDRRISVGDAEMRHGRKSKSRVINGYKRHLAVDMDSGLILAAALRAANAHEYAAMDEDLRPDLEAQIEVEELHIDRGYLAGQWVRELHEAGHRVVSKPWSSGRKGYYSKEAFDIDLQAGTATCPAGRVAAIGPSGRARFRPADCQVCSLRGSCTTSAARTVQLHEQEALLQRFKQELKTPQGRQERRDRVVVEHRLAHVTRRQGRRARYMGVRKNLFDLRRIAAVENLHCIEHQTSG